MRDFQERVPIKEFIVDIVEEDELDEPLENATIVFHMAARTMDLGMYTKPKRYMEDNFQGTKQLVFSMIDKRVKWMVNTSDAFSTLTCSDSRGASENTAKTVTNENFTLGPYAKSKFYAERWLSCSSARTFSRGKEVKVVTVRPTILYGEGDNWLVPYYLQFCTQHGTLSAINKANGPMSITYAGNCAYMHLLAAEHLMQKPDVLDGEVFNCTDETVAVNFYSYIEPFARNAGCKLRNLDLPYSAVFVLYAVVEWFFLFLFYAFGVRYDHLMMNSHAFGMVNYSTLTATSSKARLVLDYKPVYEPQEAMERTIKWWKDKRNAIGPD
ncbi:unnamed protein product [Soboliphyme baturini]|uniref:3Beta_HSD domain-containing protein n=1 Tax=Soboliphyme baturini TaxID=241478 RepID=A0A183IVU6_9BILA|nr:unnamed protein product [Soboliphyme baturini]